MPNIARRWPHAALPAECLPPRRALSYLSSDDSNAKLDALLEHPGILKQIVALMQSPSSAISTPAVRTAGNIVSGNEAHTQAAIDCGVLPAFKHLMGDASRRKQKKEVVWALSNITAGTKAQIQAVIDAGLLEPLLHEMKHGEAEVRLLVALTAFAGNGTATASASR